MPSIDNVSSGASNISSAINLAKTIIGAGLLSMPLAYATDGTIFGTFIIIIAAFTSGFGLFIQAYVSRYIATGHANFFGLCLITYPQLSVIFDIAIAIQCFGCAISYLVLIGDLMPTIITNVPYVDEKHYRTFWLLFSALFTVPLSFAKKLDALRYTSILALISIFYISLLVVSHFFINDIPRSGIIEYFPSSVTGVFSTFSIIVFAFSGQQNMFSIINEAKDKSLTNLTRLINFAIILSSVLFIGVGLAGYLTFGSSVNGNVILSYPNGAATWLGRLCIVFMVLFSFPLMFYPARISFNNIYYSARKRWEEKSEEVNESTLLLQGSNEGDAEEQTNLHVVPFTHKTFVVLTIFLLITAYTLAISLKSFAFVLAIVGATGSTSISFILPGLFGYKLIGSELDDPSALEKIFKYLSLGLTIWGVLVMIVCLYSSLAL